MKKKEVNTHTHSQTNKVFLSSCCLLLPFTLISQMFFARWNWFMEFTPVYLNICFTWSICIASSSSSWNRLTIWWYKNEKNGRFLVISSWLTDTKCVCVSYCCLLPQHNAFCTVSCFRFWLWSLLFLCDASTKKTWKENASFVMECTQKHSTSFLVYRSK